MKIFDTQHSFHVQTTTALMDNILGISCHSLQGDTFEVGIALLTAASLSG